MPAENSPHPAERHIPNHHLHPKPGSGQPAIQQAAVSTVNISETLAVLIRRGMTPETARDCLRPLLVDIVAFDQDLALEAAILKVRTRGNGLSLGDCACLATAQWMKATAVTCDEAWIKLAGGIQVLVLRPR